MWNILAGKSFGTARGWAALFGNNKRLKRHFSAPLGTAPWSIFAGVFFHGLFVWATFMETCLARTSPIHRYWRYTLEGHHDILHVCVCRTSRLLPNLYVFEVCARLVPSSLQVVSLWLQCDCERRFRRFDSRGCDYGLWRSTTSFSLLDVAQKFRFFTTRKQWPN